MNTIVYITGQDPRSRIQKCVNHCDTAPHSVQSMSSPKVWRILGVTLITFTQIGWELELVWWYNLHVKTCWLFISSRLSPMWWILNSTGCARWVLRRWMGLQECFFSTEYSPRICKSICSLINRTLYKWALHRSITNQQLPEYWERLFFLPGAGTFLPSAVFKHDVSACLCVLMFRILPFNVVHCLTFHKF